MVRAVPVKRAATLAAFVVGSPTRRFVAFALAAYVAVCALVGLDLLRSYRDVMAEAKTSTTRLSQILSEQSTHTLKTLDALIVRDPIPADAIDRLVRRLGPSLGIRAMAYFDPEGNIVGKERPELLAPNIAKLDFFAAQTSADAGLYIGHPLRDAEAGRWIIPMSRRLQTADKSFIGIAVILVDLEYLRSFYQTADLGPDGIVTLVLADGTVLVREPGPADIVGRSLAARRLFLDELAQAPSGNFRDRSRIDGIDRVLSYTRIAGAPLVIVVGTGVEPAMAQWYRELRADILAAVIIGVLLLLSALVLSRRETAGEAVLRAREDHVRRMTDNLPGAIFSRVLHADGRVEYPYMSPGGEKILGYSPGELAADPALMLATVHPDDREHVLGALQQSTDRIEPWSIEMRVSRRDGDVKWVHALSHPRHGERGEIVWDGFLLDVTERKRAEAALEAIRLELQKKNHVLDIAFDNMRQGLAVHDAQHRLLAYNPRFEELFKLPRGFLQPGLTYRDIFDCSMALGNYAPNDAERLWEERRRVVESRDRHVLSQHMADGRVIEAIYQPLADGGSVITFTDVTETVQRAAELAAKSAFLQVTLEHMGDGISVYDRDRRLKAWNDRYFDLLGLPKEFAKVGTRWGDIIRHMAAQGEYGDEREELLAGLKRELTDKPQRHWERRRPNGTVIEFLRNPMPDGGFVTVYRDITALKETQEALIAAKEEAEQANRSKGEFLANMSHELRTPLNAIIGFSEILRDQLFGPLGSVQYVDYSRHIHDSGTHLLDLINDVLDMSKIEAGGFELDEDRIELPPLIRACFDMVQTRSEASGVSLLLDLPAALPAIHADARSLKQIVLNLLSNGVKFTPPGGKVTLSAACGADGMSIVVSDSGIGIASEAVARVMRPFSQADASISRRFGGTGLGLPISKRLVELHGGSLTIESVEGAGTTVTVLLPADRVLYDAARLQAAQQ